MPHFPQAFMGNDKRGPHLSEPIISHMETAPWFANMTQTLVK